jgi:hypothetical protein
MPLRSANCNDEAASTGELGRVISACRARELPVKEKTCFHFIRRPSRRKAEIGETLFRRVVVRPMLHQGKTIPEAMKRLIELFAAHSADRATLDELHQMASDRGTWNRAHDLFQRIRKRSLHAYHIGDMKLKAQLGFEEACAKTLYNLSGHPAPFDSDSPYWI